MQTDIHPNRASRSTQAGFTLVQVLVTVAIMAILSTLAVMGYRGVARARERLALMGEARKFAGFIEKARMEAVRRHSNATVQAIDAFSYSVTMDPMDANGDGNIETTTYPLPQGFRFSTDPGAVSFDWRGRTSTIAFAVQGPEGLPIRIEVSSAGDVTVEGDVDEFYVPPTHDVTPVDGVDTSGGPAPSSSPAPTPAPTPPGDTTPDPPPPGDTPPDPPPPGDTPPDPPPPGDTPPDPPPDPDPEPDPAPGGGVSCLSVTPSSFTMVKKSSKIVTVTVNSTQAVSVSAAAAANNLSVSPSSKTFTGGQPFTITSKDPTRGDFTVSFQSSCGKQDVKFTITN